MRSISVKIIYKTKKLERICTDAKTAIKVYGREMANKIHQRIDEISAADSIEMMLRFHIGRCHQLSQNRKGQFAVDLIHPYRLVFEKIGEEIQAVQIIEIVDYH